MVGTIEGTVGDKVLVRFGDVVVQLPAEMLVEAGE
jgi:class 3 adenylate cyclase